MWHQQNKTQSNLCCLCLFALLSCFPSTCTNCTEAISSIMTKVEMKNISIGKCESVWPFCKWETFLPFEGTNSSEAAFYQKDLLLMEQPIGYGKKKKCANGKKSFRLQMDIFCHLDFCHNRKNAFSCCCLPDFFLLVGLFDILWLRAFLKISGLCLLIIKRELHKSQYIFAIYKYLFYSSKTFLVSWLF